MLKVKLPELVAFPVEAKMPKVAEAAVFAPTKISSDVVAGASAPEFLCQKPLAVAAEDIKRFVKNPFFQKLLAAPRLYVSLAEGKRSEAMLPETVNVLPEGITALPLKVATPLTFSALPTVVFPEE